MGSGTRLKILEAMASGCAVVATSTAASGLLDAVKEGIAIADDAHKMAETIIYLLQNRTERRRLGQTAQTRVKEHYDWSALIPRLLAAYGEIGLG